MKKAREHAPHKGFMLQQGIRGATAIKRLRGRHHRAPVTSSVMPERSRLGNVRVIVLALFLLLFSLLGMVTAITGAYALTPHQLSAGPVSGKPTGTPSPRHSPTPTTIATGRAPAPASAPPPVKATTPSPTSKPRVSQRQTPVSPLPTPSTDRPAVQQQRGVALVPPSVMGILSGIALVAFLVAGGLLLLRKWLLPVRKVKLPPSGAAPWQRVRPTSLPGSMNSSGSSMQQFPMTDASLPAMRERNSAEIRSE
jgi:hypothetical protein